MPQEIGNIIIYCYTTGEYADTGDNYGATTFCIKYKNEVYTYSSVSKWFGKILDLMLEGTPPAEDHVQFDDSKLMKLFVKLMEIEHGGYSFEPNKNRKPHYTKNVFTEMSSKKGYLEIWDEGDPVTVWRGGDPPLKWIKNDPIVTWENEIPTVSWKNGGTIFISENQRPEDISKYFD